MRFNTQPPEGGWLYSHYKADDIHVSTHSRPKAAGAVMRCTMAAMNTFQHTAARRRLAGGGLVVKVEELVSTHSRPKAAGNTFATGWMLIKVSTHSRPKAAGPNHADRGKDTQSVSTHSRPKAAGVIDGRSHIKLSRVSTHSRPKAAGDAEMADFFDVDVSTHSRPKAAGQYFVV